MAGARSRLLPYTGNPSSHKGSTGKAGAPALLRLPSVRPSTTTPGRPIEPMPPPTHPFRGPLPGDAARPVASGLALALAFALALGPVAGCTGPGPAARTVERAIERHGGDAYRAGEITFSFRGTPFRIEQSDGRFRYERRYTDEAGRAVREILSNEGVALEVDGEAVLVDAAERDRIATAVNSVVYFGFLPYRLTDPAVRLRDLGDARVDGEPYRKVEVTFRPEGGGIDWEDRFVYWFHAEDHTLDYLAYRYHRDGGGTRFRRAFNRRTVGGILVQDYENYAAPEPVADIADYDRLFEEGRLEVISVVALEDLVVDGDPEPSVREGTR